MYMATRRYEGIKDPAKVAQVVKDVFVPILKSVPGFVSYHFSDAGNGVMVSTTIFESRAGAEQSNAQAADFVKAKLASLVPGRPVTTEGEVVVKS
jgi:hypothetical protein